MVVAELLALLTEKNVKLSVADGKLRVRGAAQAVDPSLQAALRENKDTLLALIRSGEYSAPADEGHRIVGISPNGIPDGCESIEPEMLSLVQLSAQEIEHVVGTVPGGAANVADVYPLAPLQEGILFHHLLADEGDPFLLRSFMRFDSRTRLDEFTAALQAVIERHDILRTSVVWEGLAEPVQVVWRRAQLVVEEVELDPAAGDTTAQLAARFDPRHYRLNVNEAPLMRAAIACDASTGRWSMVLLFHHMVSDHTTLEVILEEVAAYLTGRAAALPAPLPFRNFVAQARSGVSVAEHEAFFEEMLGDVDEPTAPLGLRDVHGDGSDIVQERAVVERELSRRLRAQARASGVSVASVFHLAWARVLGALSGREDVVFGTVLFGRMQGGHGADRVLGLFINTLPVRIAVGDDDVKAGVRRTHALLAKLLRHEHASLSLAQRCSAVPAPAPLFSALLNYRHSKPAGNPAQQRPFDGIELLGGQERTNYPLTLSVDDLGEDFVLTAQVQSPLDAARICGFMHTALEQLANALERAPSTPVRRLGVLSPAERAQVLVEWNATETAYPADRCAHELFEQRAAETPDTIAVVYDDTRLSYGELNAQANRLAHYVRSLGVGPDTRVALYVERSVEMIVGLLAVLKAGGAYVPLDPSYPIERLAYMLEDSAPAAVLTLGVVPDAVRTLFADRPVLDLQADAKRWEGEPAVDPERTALTPQHLVYVIYTSGSTGRPKGVMVEHRGLVSSTCARLRVYGDGQRMLLVSSISFDSSVASVFGTLASGGTLVVVRLDAIGTPALFRSLVQSQRITGVLGVPSFLHTMLDEPSEPNGATLRNIIFAGEACPATLVARVAALEPQAALYNEYGPTECTVWSTVHRCSPHDTDAVVPIGRPIGNTRVYILDAHGEPVPIGVAGELYIGGAGVARGYLNRPELTAERFVASPFAPGDRLYRTGDLVRYLPDGTIEFLGRTDFQVKIRGFRIELGEIEARLAQHEAVRDVVVLAREDVPGEKRLVAYCTPAGGGAEISAEALRAHVSAALPEYMVPAAYVQVETLPLTPNGKLDRRALPSPAGSAYAVRAYEAPVGELEQTLAQLWCEALGLERVGRQDNFFELGGHSLLVIRVLGALRKAGVKNATMADLFRNPTIESLAGRLQSDEPQTMPPGIIPVRTGGDQPPLFLIHEVHGLDMYFPLLAANVDPDIPIYGLPGVPLDQPQLETLESLAARMVGFIRTAQPHGPYRMAGWSFGGMLAYEIAVQLLAQGEKIGFLGMIDTYAPALLEHGDEPPLTAQRTLLNLIRERRELDGREASMPDGLDGLGFEETFRICSESGLLPAGFMPQAGARLEQYCLRLGGHLNALRFYTVQPIPIPIHLYAAAEETTASVASPLRGWDAILPADRVTLTKTHGSHLTMIGQRELGQAISADIRRGYSAER